MKKYNGSGLTPLFHSEISSSYMLYDIFKDHDKKIIAELIRETFKIAPDKITVERERSYPQKGSIDIFVQFMYEGKRHALLIEVKVHDYLSATDGQIGTYYNAVLEDGSYDQVYFIYLTQFTSATDFQGIATPKTIDEANKAQKLIKDQFVHMSWEQMHNFLNKYYGILSPEQQLIVSLNKQWLTQQCQSDMENNKIDVGERGIEDYFYDINLDLRQCLPFGQMGPENKRQILRIDASSLDAQQLETVLHAITTLIESEAINKRKQYQTEELTLQAAKEFLAQLAQRSEDWLLLSFYARLFLLLEETSYLKFNGTGTRGFSIKVEIIGKGEISLCTLYRNRTIDFSLKR